MELLALENDKKSPKRKIKPDGLWINLSGLENMAEKLYKDTNDKNLTAAFVLDYIGNSLLELTKSYETLYGKGEFLFSGGVMSNSIIKSKISSVISSSSVLTTLLYSTPLDFVVCQP